jgi:outer membrane immunogenic protein
LIFIYNFDTIEIYAGYCLQIRQSVLIYQLQLTGKKEESMTKRIVLFAVAAILAFVPMAANAAGPAAFSWTGPYVGVQGLYAAGNTEWEYTSNGATADHFITGGMGGLFVGFNYQFPVNVVVGIEAEGNGGSIQGAATCPNPTWGCHSNVVWLGSTRVRAGYAIDRFLPYVTVGVAYGGIDIYTKNSAGTKFGELNTYVGWTPGAGVEFAITKNIIARAEYSWYDFGKQHSNVDGGLRIDQHVTAHTAKLGVSFKFW